MTGYYILYFLHAENYYWKTTGTPSINMLKNQRAKKLHSATFFQYNDIIQYYFFMLTVWNIKHVCDLNKKKLLLSVS